MLTLYIKTGCPYSAKVLARLAQLGVEIPQKNIEDPALEKELIALGGKKQTPFLIDSETEIKMYESGAIIAYLNEHYKEHSTDIAPVRLHREHDDDVCEVCQ